MNRRGFLTSSSALLATTMLCPVKTLSGNAVLASARRAQSAAIATYGRSPAMSALGDIRALQAAMRREILALPAIAITVR